MKRTVIRTLILLLFSLLYLGIGFLIAILISYNSDSNIQDIMTYEGLILIIIGILMSMKGNPSGISISRMGSKDASLSAYLNNEITRQEREINPYHKEYFKNNVVEFAFNNLSFIIGGILILVLCYFIL